MEAYFHIDKQEILLALECMSPLVSLNELIDDESGISVEDRLDVRKDNYDSEMYIILKEELKNLEERDKKIILLRYYRNKTQSEVAKILGVSQVQVSRLEARIISKLKQKIL